MTEMRRVTISLPDEMDKKILELRKDDRFVKCSYAEIVRQIVEQGLDVVKSGKKRSHKTTQSFPDARSSA